MNKGLAYFLLALALLLHTTVRSQQEHPVLKKLDSLIEADAFESIQEMVTAERIKEGDNSSLNLGKLVYPLAKSEFLLKNDTDFPLAQNLLKDLEANKHADSIQYEAFLGLGLVHIDQGNILKANEFLTRANDLANIMNDAQRKVASEFHLGEIGLKLGDVDQLAEHTDKALGLMGTYPKARFPLAPRILNYKASLMHLMAKPDSANYYFEMAIKSVNSLEQNPERQYYLPGTIYGNWTMVKQSAGDYEAAMELTLRSISSFNNFLQNTHNHFLTEKVHGNLSIAYRNLGSIYNDQGDKEKAIQVATLGYNHAKKHFRRNTVQYFSAVLMMAEAHIYGESVEKGSMFLKQAEASLLSIPGDNWSYAANLYFAMADLERKKGNSSSAIAYYQKTLEAYTNSSADEFSQNIIYARANLAQVYAENEQFEEALSLGQITYSKVVKAYGIDSYLAHMLQLSKIKIYFLMSDFEGAIELCKEFLGQSDNAGNVSNRPFIWNEKTEVLLYLAKSKLNLLPHSLKNLFEISQIIDEATSLVEKRKSLVTSQEAIGNLIANNKEVFNVAKKVYLELYQQTQDRSYLEKVMALHESSIYNRIRARLNLTDDALAPIEIREHENSLRNQINEFFKIEDSETQFNVAEWDSLMDEWQNHLSLVRKEYPAYYKMRYASVVEPLKKLRNHIPSETTLVRYFSDGDNTYVYIYKGGMEHLVKLDRINDLCISSISDYGVPENEVFDCLHQLYQIIWAPIENLVNTENIIIFPDGELFNLAFELLTPQKISSNQDLATGSLLAKHTISYNYSLFMLRKKQKVMGYKEDFIAFAPEFDEEMKTHYQMAISDSLSLDQTYLTLLPQPFSTELVKKFSSKFDGHSFLNERASKQLFTKNAKEHKIIHVGTHAESNNVSPELSRLIFAKNVSASLNINNNSLYTYEIYNHDLSSNLAILTACETGKPTYQPGESMISLAHAFNYAGSESILTSLWQIDEKSSSEILESFYGYLYEGKSKDEALRLAKLFYLKNHDGRTLHPQYWAGLILMGETSPIIFSKSQTWPIWVLSALLIVAFLIFFLKKPLKISPNQ